MSDEAQVPESTTQPCPRQSTARYLWGIVKVVSLVAFISGALSFSFLHAFGMAPGQGLDGFEQTMRNYYHNATVVQTVSTTSESIWLESKTVKISATLIDGTEPEDVRRLMAEVKKRYKEEGRAAGVTDVYVTLEWNLDGGRMSVNTKIPLFESDAHNDNYTKLYDSMVRAREDIAAGKTKVFVEG